jgi:hypothetical protein
LNEALLGIKIPDVSNFITQKDMENAINSIDLTIYATKTYVEELFDSINVPEGTTGMIALTRDEILNICKIIL